MVTSSESRERSILAAAIERRRADIEHRWLARVESDARGRDLSPSDLRDSMPEYLERVVAALREGQGTVPAQGVAAWESVAREHAITRVRLGFDIDELVHEFIVLRQLFYEVLEEEGLLDAKQARRVCDLIEAGIGTAVKSYVQYRDSEARKTEAEHIGFITHELRNPLTTAMVGTSQLKKSLSLTPAQTHILEVIERNHRRIAELIEGVLVLERSSSHTLKPSVAVLALRQVLEEPLALARAAAQQKGVDVTVRYDPDALVCVDPKLTRSAVENVLGNAVKYTDKGRVSLDVEDAEHDVVLHVRDHCAGLSDEELQTIFEPFRRGNSTKPGSGLGLSIARRCVEAQGGEIHAESAGQEGCHFWLTLPKSLH